MFSKNIPPKGWLLLLAALMISTTPAMANLTINALPLSMGAELEVSSESFGLRVAGAAPASNVTTLNSLKNTLGACKADASQTWLAVEFYAESSKVDSFYVGLGGTQIMYSNPGVGCTTADMTNVNVGLVNLGYRWIWEKSGLTLDVGLRTGLVAVGVTF
ncbi:MAG: hypothetical protein OEV94_07680 [Deltaproteobacteria bacterium]|nr:hypothetical protein [Deltaproteobacteria bacterium]